MSETEIRAAVEAARFKLPHLAPDFADRAVASGKTVGAVKAELLDRMLGTYQPDAGDVARAAMVASAAARYSSAVTEAVETRRRSDVDRRAAAVVPVDSAPVELDGRATARASMLRELKKVGMTPVTLRHG